MKRETTPGRSREFSRSSKWMVTRICRFAAALIAILFVASFVAAQAPPPARTTIYLHGRIYTNDPANPWASAMAVRDGKIVCIGGIEQIMLECGNGDDVETIQLQNHFVMPGFNDAHVHMGGAGADMLAVRVNSVASVEALQKAVTAAVAAHKEGDWIIGSGWSARKIRSSWYTFPVT
jgi:predicted amidohydrolase YtcJ